MDYLLVDADNHYYEAEDAFLRYGDDEVRGFVRWIQEGKRRRLLFGDTVSYEPPNPTFNPIAKPGVYHRRLKELEEGGVRRDAAGNVTASSTTPESLIHFDKSMYG